MRSRTGSRHNREDKPITKLSVDKTLIHELATLLEETGLNEITWRQGDTEVRIARGAGTMVHTALPVATASTPAAVAAAVAAPAGGGGADDLAKHPGAVISPMVGTVYLAPEPGAAPFVAVGDTVKLGQTVLIVEAMKTMNPIPAPRAGKVTQILVENQAPAEFGQALMLIE